MKRFFSVLVLVLMCVLCLVSCSKGNETDVPEGMVEAENKFVDYRFFYPENWILDRCDGMISCHVSKDDASNVSVTAFTPDDMKPLEDYLKEEYMTYFKANFSDMEIIEDFADTTLDNAPAKRIVFKATVGEKAYQFMQCLAYGRDGYIYIVTYTSTPEAYDSHLEDVEKIVSEFRFK